MRGTSFLATAAALMLAPTVPAQTITKIVDTTTQIPNATGTFEFVIGGPVSGTTIAFSGFGSGVSGIYTASTTGGPLTRFVDSSMTVPNDTVLFQSFSSFRMSGTNIAFTASNSTSTDPNAGWLYSGSSAGGPFVKIADASTPIPNGTGNFTNQIFWLGASDSTVAFRGQGANNQFGVYAGPLTGTSLVRLADFNTPIPNGTGTFTQFPNSNPVVNGSSVYFRASGDNGQSGIYHAPTGGGPITRFIDTSAAIPNGSGNFINFATPSIDGDVMVFRGVGSDGYQGLFNQSLSGGPITTIVDTLMPIPGGTGNFTSFGSQSFAVSSGVVAFTALGANEQRGLYVTSITGGTVTKIVARGEIFDGRRVDDVEFVADSLDGSILAFTIFTNDNPIYHRAVYTFTPVPEPTGLIALSAAAAAGAVAVGRRRKRGF